ncbi:hypothetical protein D3C80_824590 [compost metagenome]
MIYLEICVRRSVLKLVYANVLKLVNIIVIKLVNVIVVKLVNYSVVILVNVNHEECSYKQYYYRSSGCT